MENKYKFIEQKNEYRNTIALQNGETSKIYNIHMKTIKYYNILNYAIVRHEILKPLGPPPIAIT